jgi:hypothetical protein
MSLYDHSVPALSMALTNLSNQIDKAAAYAERKKFDSKALVDSRLIADMLPFARQVQIACDNAKGPVGRLAGIEPPKHDFIQSVRREQFVGAETRDIVLVFPQLTLKFNGQDYLTKFALPNFYFHATVAYALLRKNGVELGKGDFLGAIQ